MVSVMTADRQLLDLSLVIALSTERRLPYAQIRAFAAASDVFPWAGGHELLHGWTGSVRREIQSCEAFRSARAT